MPELSSAARGGGMHPPRKVRRWTCADCGEHGVGGPVELLEHFDQNHPRPTHPGSTDPERNPQ